MKQTDIDRINELARKSKSVGLTEAEKAEQAKLRKQFIQEIRMDLKSQLDSIDIVEKDGSITNLGEKYGNNKNH